MESTGEVAKTTTGSDGSVPETRSNPPSDFNIAQRSETSNPPPPETVAPPPPPPPPPQNPLSPTEGFSSGPMKKKRGRPRKYPHDGATVTLSPNPISSAAPMSSHVIDFSVTQNREKVIKPATTSSSFIRTTKYPIENFGLGNNRIGSEPIIRMPIPSYGFEVDRAPSSAGAANFTPYIITVNAGEDVTKKIISFSQQGSFAICVLCANGVVSSVTLSQPDSSGGTLTYEGRFEILSLSGSFMPSDYSDGTRSRTGGMSVSLASPDGRVVGGSVAGLLVAATPIQVVLGSFLAGTNQQDQNPKMRNHNFMPSPMPTTSSNADDHRMIRPMSSSPKISTWLPPFPSDQRNKQSHDINVTLT